MHIYIWDLHNPYCGREREEREGGRERRKGGVEKEEGREGGREERRRRLILPRYFLMCTYTHNNEHACTKTEHRNTCTWKWKQLYR